MSPLNFLIIGLSCIFTFGIFSTKAQAEYSFCNKTSYALSAAVGYPEDGRMVTRGWWRLRAGQCKIVMTEAVSAGRYFIYAEIIPGHKGPLRAWSGSTEMCVENESLFTLRDQNVCSDDPRRQREFFAVDVPQTTNGSWRTEFAEEQNFNVYTAEVAGVQRLLRDVGMNIEHIDGKLGRSSLIALSTYRRKKGLGDTDVIDDAVIDTLIAEANELDEKLGFFFCNATRLPVWAAFAEPDQESEYTSKGWWRLDGAECAKVVRGALASDHFYVYGVMDLGEKDAPMVGGKRSFCIADVQFDAGGDVDCEQVGYEKAGFRRINVGSKKAWTFQFTPALFNPEILPDDQ